MPLAKIHYECVLLYGEKAVMITRFENMLEEQELPLEYVIAFGSREEGKKIPPYFYASPRYPPDEIFLHAPVDGDLSAYWITVGSRIPLEQYREILAWMRRAGNRLAKINRRLAAENADWRGEGVDEI